jgi:UDP-2,3-diacylglucosamine pyrophosphatase LpxH
MSARAMLTAAAAACSVGLDEEEDAMPTAPERIVVVSDLHMAPPGPLDSFKTGDVLADLVDSLRSADIPADRTLLVMNGDTFDFLQIEDRPAMLDAAGVAALVQRVLAEIGDMDWGARLYDGLTRFTDRGGHWLVIPGNHDPELHHPDAAAMLAHATGVDPARVTVHGAAEPWRAMLGNREIVIGHGNRSDPFNDIDPAAWQAAMAHGQPVPSLPPGSRLVLDTVNAFKRAGHRFVDALKPEMPGVLLLLLYIDRTLALRHLPGVAGNGAAALLRAVHRVIHNGGPTLAPGSTTQRAPADLLVQALQDALLPQERPAAASLLRDFEDWLEHGDTAAAPAGSLASHGGFRAWLLRNALRLLSYDYSFFDPGALGSTDRAIIDDLLPEGGPARVVVAGHTHAARHHVMTGGRVYINTGTWTDLMRFPGPDGNLTAWIDALEAGHVDREPLPSFADLTAENAVLHGVEMQPSASGPKDAP